MKDATWNVVAGEWFPTSYEADHPAIVIAERRATLQPDSPDYPVYAALLSDGRRLIDTSHDNIRPYVQPYIDMASTDPVAFTKRGPVVRQFLDRCDAEAWLGSKDRKWQALVEGTHHTLPAMWLA